MKKSEKRQTDSLDRPLVNRRRRKFFWVFLVELLVIGMVVISGYFIARHYLDASAQNTPMLHIELERHPN